MRPLLRLVVVVAAFVAFLRFARQTPPDRSIVSLAETRIASLPTCGGTTITSEGVGALRIGESLDSVKLRCKVVGDVTRRGLEGMIERRVLVAFPPDALEAEIVDGRVWRLAITSPAFRTTDSLGVGSPLADILKIEDVRGFIGEGNLVLLSPRRCGRSFVLSGGLPERPTQVWTREKLLALPPHTRVAKVLVVGCAVTNDALSGAPRRSTP